MPFFTGVTKNTQSTSYMLSFIVWVWLGFPLKYIVGYSLTYPIHLIWWRQQQSPAKLKSKLFASKDSCTKVKTKPYLQCDFSDGFLVTSLIIPDNLGVIINLYKHLLPTPAKKPFCKIIKRCDKYITVQQLYRSHSYSICINIG